MLTATFSEPVPHGAPNAAIPDALHVRTDQLDELALAIIEHLWTHLTGHHGITGVEVYLADDSRSGWASDTGRTLATFTVAPTPRPTTDEETTFP